LLDVTRNKLELLVSQFLNSVIDVSNFLLDWLRVGSEGSENRVVGVSENFVVEFLGLENR
jgi:hypothetical protein